MLRTASPASIPRFVQELLRLQQARGLEDVPDGKGELIEDKTSRFPFRAKCGACGWMTDSVKLAGCGGEAMERSEAREQGQSATEMKTPPKRVCALTAPQPPGQLSI